LTSSQICTINSLMPVKSNNNNRLTSWKEIAAYFECGVRTCHRWEKELGLPVYRSSKSPKSRVYAYEDELDAWFAVTFKKNHQKNEAQGKFLKHSKQICISAIAVFIVVIVSIAYSAWYKSAPVPAGFSIQGSVLTILSEKDKEIWRFDTEVKKLITEEEYLSRYQFKRRNPNTNHVYLPFISIEDLNSDSKKEVLFSIQTQDNFNEGLLLCFDHKGKELWRFQGGKELVFGKEKFSNDFKFEGFCVEDLDNDNNLEILVVSFQRDFYPTQLVVLDNSGEKIGEYWNSGRLTDIVCKDLDEDGKKEIIVAGMNNEYKKAALIVFDSGRIDGASPQGSDYKCSELPPGTENFYILFPRTDVDRLDNLLETLLRVELLRGGRVSVLTRYSNIFFELDHNLELKEIHISNSFELNHRNAVKMGRISSTLNEEYLNKLKNGLLYYDGTSWVSVPSKNNY